MKTKKKSKLQQTLDKYKAYTIVSIISVLLLTLIITNTSISSVINEKTAKYISFNNTNNTDMLSINNIKKMPNFLGKTKYNKSSISFILESSNKSNYEIVLFTNNNNIPNKYIHYYLKSNKLLKKGTLNNNSNDGIVIYKGTIKDRKKITLKMWIDRKYKNNNSNNTFEVKIKSR